MRLRLTIPADELERAQDELARIVAKGFDQNIAPHIVAIAQERAPVSKPGNFNPRKSSFQGLRLQPLGSLKTSQENEALAQLHGLSSQERSRFFRRAFGDSTREQSARKFFRGTGKNKNRTPDALRIGRGTIQGAFRHRPGTLRDSIRWDGTKVTDGIVTGTIRAHADYAKYVHEGFTHKGGKKIAPRPFLWQAAEQVADRLTDPSTYKG